jgi:hypothetical protein
MLFLCSACGASAGPDAKPYVHSATGFRFPAIAGEFRRAQIEKYNSEGTDVGVGYNLYSADKQIAVTVFVYPAPPVQDSAKAATCAEQFRSVKSDIEHAHPGARLVQETALSSPMPDRRETGQKAVYDFSGSFAGVEQRLHSEADLFCYVSGPWFIAYRATAPAKLDYQPDLMRLQRLLTWPR